METTPPRRKRRKRRRILIGLGSLVLLGVVLIGLRWIAVMQTPIVTIPNPTMPHPNAFDFYVTAGNAVTFENTMKPEVDYSLAQKEAFVRQDTGVITTLHQGFEHPYLHPPIRSYDAIFPYYAGFRKMARLLALRGQVQAAKGDWQGATDNYLDALRLGGDIPRGAPLIGVFTGMSCQSIGRKSMWITVEHLNVPQIHAALDRMTRIQAGRFPFADTIEEEKWGGQAERLAIFRDSRKRTDFLMPSDMENSPEHHIAQSLSGFVYLVYSDNSPGVNAGASTQSMLGRCIALQRFGGVSLRSWCLCRAPTRILGRSGYDQRGSYDFPSPVDTHTPNSPERCRQGGR